MTRSSRVKPLKSKSMSERCPSLRKITWSICTNNVQQRRRRDEPAKQLFGFVFGDGNTSSRMCQISAWSTVDNFAKGVEATFLGCNGRRRHAIRHKPLTLLHCGGHLFCLQRGCVCQTPVRGNWLRHRSTHAIPKRVSVCSPAKRMTSWLQ